jgi:hypothetical protein
LIRFGLFAVDENPLAGEARGFQLDSGWSQTEHASSQGHKLAFILEFPQSKFAFLAKQVFIA